MKQFEQTIMIIGGALVAALISISISTSAFAKEPVRILEIKNFVGRIEMRTSSNPNIELRVVPGRKANANITQNANTAIVNGGFAQPVLLSCVKDGGRDLVRINGTNYEMRDLPTIVATGSVRNGLRVKDSMIFGNVGDIGGASLTLLGCGSLVLGNVAHDLEVENVGGSSFRAGNIGGNAQLSVAGRGNIVVHDVANNLRIDLVGSGQVRAEDIGNIGELGIAGSGNIILASARSVDASIAGSGDIEIIGGRSNVEVGIVGTGDFVHRGISVSPIVSVIGKGNVRLATTESGFNTKGRKR